MFTNISIFILQKKKNTPKGIYDFVVLFHYVIMELL